MSREDPDPAPLFDTLVLYGETVVQPAADSAPNAVSLANPHGLPMQILEIRFRVYPDTTVIPAAPTNFSFRRLTGQCVGVKMDLGKIPVVDAQVPVSAFGSGRDESSLETADTQVIGSTVNLAVGVQPDRIAIYPNADNSSAIEAVPATYWWRLRHPLYVPPGAVLQPTFTHLGQTHFPVVVQVAYICRSLPEDFRLPAKIMVPWVGSYNSKSFDNVAGTGAGTDQSTELDLFNPFPVDMEVSKLTGRCSFVSVGVTGTSVFGDAWEDQTDHLYALATLRAKSSRGDEITSRSGVPFGGLFPAGWKAWDIPAGWSMRPGEFYKFRLSVAAVGYTAVGSLLGRVQYTIGLIGYRPVETRAVAGGAP